MVGAGVPHEPRSDEQRAWDDPTVVVEGLEQASCGPHAKVLAMEGIAVAGAGGTAEDWRTEIADRHRDHPGWQEHLEEAQRCMRASGLWPWSHEKGS